LNHDIHHNMIFILNDKKTMFGRIVFLHEINPKVHIYAKGKGNTKIRVSVL